MIGLHQNKLSFTNLHVFPFAYIILVFFFFQVKIYLEFPIEKTNGTFHQIIIKVITFYINYCFKLYLIINLPDSDYFCAFNIILSKE